MRFTWLAGWLVGAVMFGQGPETGAIEKEVAGLPAALRFVALSELATIPSLSDVRKAELLLGASRAVAESESGERPVPRRRQGEVLVALSQYDLDAAIKELRRVPHADDRKDMANGMLESMARRNEVAKGDRVAAAAVETGVFPMNGVAALLRLLEHQDPRYMKWLEAALSAEENDQFGFLRLYAALGLEMPLAQQRRATDLVVKRLRSADDNDYYGMARVVLQTLQAIDPAAAKQVALEHGTALFGTSGICRSGIFEVSGKIEHIDQLIAQQKKSSDPALLDLSEAERLWRSEKTPRQGFDQAKMLSDYLYSFHRYNDLIRSIRWQLSSLDGLYEEYEKGHTWFLDSHLDRVSEMSRGLVEWMDAGISADEIVGYAASHNVQVIVRVQVLVLRNGGMIGT